MTGPLGLGTAPSITDPAAATNFSALADAFFASLSVFEQNLASYGNGVSLGFYSASSTSVTVPSVSAGGTINVTLTVAASKGYAVGMPVMAVATAAVNTARMLGTVTAYNSSTGVLTVAVQHTIGAGGTYASWSVVMCAPIQNTLLWTLVDSTASATINCANANYFSRTVNGATTFVFSGAPSGQAYSFTLEVAHTSGTITWPANVYWPYGISAPSLTAGKKHLFVFSTTDGGSIWHGGILPNYNG